MNQTEQTEIEFGYKTIEGKRVGYATYIEPTSENKIELINVPYGGLFVKINDELKHKPGGVPYHYVMLWTKVAGWLGSRDLLNSFKGGN